MLTRDAIAALRHKSGWQRVYQRLHRQGLVAQKTLSQALSSYSRSREGRGDMIVINTANGEQLVFSNRKTAR